jgi:hypothetical protein
VLVDIAPELDARGRIRIGSEMTEQRAPIFQSIEEYARLLSRNYPAGSPEALQRMARYGLRKRADGAFELKSDPKLRSERGDPAEARAQEEALAQRMWDALAKLPCPTRARRRLRHPSPEIADRMVDEVPRTAASPSSPRPPIRSRPTTRDSKKRSAPSCWVRIWG